MKASTRLIATFSAGACAGILATNLYLRSSAGQSVAVAKTEPAVTSPGLHNPTGKGGVSSAGVIPDIARGAAIAHALVPGDAPAQKDAESRTAHGNTADASYSFDSEINAGRNNVKKRFEAEPEDGEWAPGAQGTLRASIDALPGRSSVGNMDIDCRSTMCRVTMIMDMPATLSEKDVANEVNLFTTNLQGDWPTKPPASDAFDDRDVMFSMDSRTNEVTVEMFVHRRHQGGTAPAHSA